MSLLSTNPNDHYVFDNGDLTGPIEAPRVKQYGADFTVGDEATNVVIASMQLTYNGAPLDHRVAGQLYLSADGGGAALHGDAPTGAVAVSSGHGGILVTNVAKLSFLVVTSATGRFDITVTEAGTREYYLAFVLPTGRIAVSADALTFAA